MSTTPTELACPLCEVTFDAPVVQRSDAIAAVFGMSGETMQRLHMDQQHGRLEQEMDRHLRTHQPSVWVPALMAARRELDQARAVVTAAFLSVEVASSEQKLIDTLLAEVAASRAYIRSIDPKPGPENLFRAWVNASADSAIASAEFRFALQEQS